MKFAVLALSLLCLESQGYLLLIDDFSQEFIATPGVHVTATDPNLALCSTGSRGSNTPTILGGQMDLKSCGKKGTQPNNGVSKMVIGGTGTLAMSAESNVYGSWYHQWDGPDESDAIGSFNTPVDFYTPNSGCAGGNNERAMYIYIEDNDACHFVNMKVYDAHGNVCEMNADSPRLEVPGLGCFAQMADSMAFQFKDFTAITNGGSYDTEMYPCDFRQITAITTEIDGIGQTIDALDAVWDYITLGCCLEDEDCGNVCTTVCLQNECKPRDTPINCDDANACTNDVCNPTDGTCSNPPNQEQCCDGSGSPVGQGTACGVATACSPTGTCDAGGTCQIDTSANDGAVCGLACSKCTSGNCFFKAPLCASCTNMDSNGQWEDSAGKSCLDYELNPLDCANAVSRITAGQHAVDRCCVCGGGSSGGVTAQDVTALETQIQTLQTAVAAMLAAIQALTPTFCDVRLSLEPSDLPSLSTDIQNLAGVYQHQNNVLVESKPVYCAVLKNLCLRIAVIPSIGLEGWVIHDKINYNKWPVNYYFTLNPNKDLARGELLSGTWQTGSVTFTVTMACA